MAVTDGDYVTEESVTDWMALYSSGFTSTTTPTDTQVSRLIALVEGRVNSRLAARGFTVPVTGAGTDGLAYLRDLGSMMVAARCLEMATVAGRRGVESASDYIATLKEDAAAMLDAVAGDGEDNPGDPRILTEAGITSDFADDLAALVVTWQTENDTLAEATTPTFKIESEW